MIDLTGTRFRHLVVIGFDHKTKRILPSGKSSIKYYWKCECDCGNTTIVCSNNLKNGSVISCGCKWRAWLYSSARKTHGKEPAKLYKCWANMIQRCENPKNKSYCDYGIKGICVCAEWRSSFELFRDWAMSNGWDSQLEIDRIDPNGNYNPSNCRWVTETTQARNRLGKVVPMTLNGRTQLMVEWAEELGIEASTIQRRRALGWSDARALTTPVKKRANRC
jgi:hypothetical protein